MGVAPFTTVLLLAMALSAAGCATPAPRAPADEQPGATASSVPIENDFGSTVVYGTDRSLAEAPLRADCARRGGTFNTCGSPCRPGTDMCAQVCAFTCENIPQKLDHSGR